MIRMRGMGPKGYQMIPHRLTAPSETVPASASSAVIMFVMVDPATTTVMLKDRVQTLVA